MNKGQKLKVLIFVLFIFVIAISFVDISVSNILLQGDDPYYMLRLWLIAMPILSLAVALAYWVGAPNTDKNLKIAVGIFLTTLILTTISGLTDVIWFYIREGGMPPPERNLDWFFQSQIFGGHWDSQMHIIWMAFWLFVFLPCLWIFLLRRK